MASAEDIALLRDLTGYTMDEKDCKRLLQISNNDIGQAASKFFDTDPANLQNLLRNSEATWDQSAFGSAGFGVDDANIPTFHIDSAPDIGSYPHSTGHSRAPTRPPSRSSQRSILSTHAGDPPMQSIESVQESGFIGSSTQAFGPATKDSYDASQWAMVPTTTEVIADSIPSQRKREEGEPAILKPSPNFNYLTALIPILHSIPLYRNALLTPAVRHDDYWMGDEWWKGNVSPPARVIDHSIGLAESQKRDIVYETQRLIAFLDGSERMYASVGAMLDSDAWREYQGDVSDPDDDILKFLMSWSEAYEMLTPNASLKGSLKTVFDVGGELRDTFLLDGTVTRNTARSGLDIYDVLDDTLFSPATGNAHITDIGKVLILRLSSSTTNASDLGCRIPATLYVDRYLAENKHVIDSMYKDVKQYEDQHVKNTEQIEKLKWHVPQKEGAKRVESLKLLKTAIAAFETSTDDVDARTRDAKTLAQLQHLTSSIEMKLKALDEEAEMIKKAIQQVSSHFKPLIDDASESLIDISPETPSTSQEYPVGQAPADAMHHPYTLVGVATRRDVVYLLHPASHKDKRQWWRMQYDTESASPTIRRDKQSAEEVLERATSESASVLLVYATEEAMNAEPEKLSKELENFVKQDNLVFLEEVQKSRTDWDEYDNGGYSDVARGGWDKDDDPDSWEEINAQRWHEDNAMNMSSATLTPNTEVDGGGGVREMVEINGGMDVAMGLDDPSSREGMDKMEFDEFHGKPERMEGILGDEEPRTQHIEVAEKKGG